ncbi:MAG: hemerythrin family protein [Deltaproteobacteria bacterium]|jgi:hemerythrin|nr:hemerythrin family protein [Deltaproteobacteria bacterium]
MLWSKNLETGIPKIDEQHKELFRQADFLVDSSKSDKVEVTLNFLKDYVSKHFSDEEAYQRGSQYPKYEDHRKLHVEFAAIFKKKLEEYKQATNKTSVLLGINSIVVNWLKEHIMRHDREFAAFYLQKKN